MSKEDWKAEWQPMVEAVGTDFSEGESVVGADVVEEGLIRRFLEPLEFDCELHYDEEIAQKYGYETTIAPYSSLYTWTLHPYWIPGEKLFTSDDRNAQPTNSPVTPVKTELAPKTTGYFATNIEADYLRPIVVGDRLTRKGQVLLSCIPKETSVGRGAFMMWETKIINQHDEEIAVFRMETYSYNAHK